MAFQFELEVSPVRRRRAPVPQLVAVLVVALVALAIAKPWVPPAPIDEAPEASSGAAAARAPAASSGGRSSTDAGASAGATPGQPIPRASSGTIALIVDQLVTRAGSWGIGTGGPGQRYIRDAPWADWTSVEPVSSGPYSSIGRWPGTALCAETPTLDDHALLVSVTAPHGLTPDWRVEGWWTDGATFNELGATIHQISPPGNRQISYLERADGAQWPDGRYEFHVVSGSDELAMTVCIGRV